MASTTPNFAFPYPEPTDTPDVPRDIKALADRSDAVLTQRPLLRLQRTGRVAVGTAWQTVGAWAIQRVVANMATVDAATGLITFNVAGIFRWSLCARVYGGQSGAGVNNIYANSGTVTDVTGQPPYGGVNTMGAKASTINQSSLLEAQVGGTIVTNWQAALTGGEVDMVTIGIEYVAPLAAVLRAAPPQDDAPPFED